MLISWYQKYDMKIVLIGSGNVACSLGQMFLRSGHQVLQVINRSPERGEKLAGLLNAAFSTSFAEADPTADLYLVALADRAIPPPCTGGAYSRNGSDGCLAGGIRQHRCILSSAEFERNPARERNNPIFNSGIR